MSPQIKVQQTEKFLTLFGLTASNDESFLCSVTIAGVIMKLNDVTGIDYFVSIHGKDTGINKFNKNFEPGKLSQGDPHVTSRERIFLIWSCGPPMEESHQKFFTIH